MDATQKATAKGKELRSAGWAIKGIRVSQETSAPLPEGRHIFLLKMDPITDDQMKGLYEQVRRDDDWLVLFDFGDGYTGFYTAPGLVMMKAFLRRYPPLFVWDSASERKAQSIKASASRKRSGT